MKEVQRFNPGNEAASKWREQEGGDNKAERKVTKSAAPTFHNNSGNEGKDSDSDKTVSNTDDEMTTDDDMTTIPGDDCRHDGVVTDSDSDNTVSYTDDDMTTIPGANNSKF